MNISHFRCFSDHWIDHNHCFGRVLTKILQKSARSRYAVRVPRIFSQKKRDVALMKVTFHHGAEHLAVHPELPGFFLGQGAGAINAV